MSAPWLMLAALAIEGLFGWPDALDRRIGHPVRWFGTAVAWVDARTNRVGAPRRRRIIVGGLAAVALTGLFTGAGATIACLLPDNAVGFAVSAIVASTLVASHSLHRHVAAVGIACERSGTEAARTALSRIVGRDTAALDDEGIARAAIESLAENTSDGVTAPLFWGAIFGLPGLFGYKAINTLDSMIGHRNARHEAFGKVAARLDDLVNLIPARLTGLLYAACAISRLSFATMIRDASKHRSPNAGWPEAAMAGALGIRLSGPRLYGGKVVQEPWLNGPARDPSMRDLPRALALYRRLVAMLGVMLALAGWAIAA